VAAAKKLNPPPAAVPFAERSSSSNGPVVHLDDRSLRSPVDRGVGARVQSLLQRGERSIVLDLGRVASIDAAGMGELVRAYNLAAASDARLRISNTPARVRHLLERVGLFSRLSA
jgi:ABC-type transporter Mla MlaB component